MLRPEPQPVVSEPVRRDDRRIAALPQVLAHRHALAGMRVIHRQQVVRPAQFDAVRVRADYHVASLAAQRVEIRLQRRPAAHDNEPPPRVLQQQLAEVAQRGCRIQRRNPRIAHGPRPRLAVEAHHIRPLRQAATAMHLVAAHVGAPLGRTADVILQEALIAPLRPAPVGGHVACRIGQPRLPHPRAVGRGHEHEARPHHARVGEILQHCGLAGRLGQPQHHGVQVDHEHVAFQRRPEHLHLGPPPRPAVLQRAPVHARNRRHVGQAHQPGHLSREPAHVLGAEVAAGAQHAAGGHSSTSTVRSHP